MNRESGIDTSVAGCSNAAIRTSDTETNPSNDTTVVVPAAKKVRRQRFREAWLKEPQFQVWLQETESPYQVKCRICSKFLQAGKTYLQQHAKTATHSANMQRKAAAASISVPSSAATTSSDAGVTAVTVGSNAAITSSENDLSADASIAEPTTASTSSAVKDNSSSDSCFVADPAKKAKRRQAFRQEWLADPNFKSWLQEAEDRYKARCAVCSKNLLAGKTELQKHAESLTHKINLQCRNCNCTCHRT